MTGAGGEGRILVTGGAGFIGSAFVRHLLAATPHRLLNFDKLTYAANPDALAEAEDHPRYRFVRGDIADPAEVAAAVRDFRPTAIVNFAAESHVDRSIDDAAEFVRTNVLGTQVLLDAARAWIASLPSAEADTFRLLHVSTDEVYGSLGPEGAFTEASPYAPNSPYAASKASADHLVRAWHRTYGLPTMITNCSNNYGPWQFPEKLIPLAIVKALSGEAIPIYGKGDNVRDWLYVQDHVRAVLRVLEAGRPGRGYNVGGGAELSNLELVRRLCALLDGLSPRPDGQSYAEQITFVADRPGHDWRYAIDATRMRDELGWQPAESIDSGLERTVRWYLDHAAWWRRVRAERYGGQRLGTRTA